MRPSRLCAKLLALAPGLALCLGLLCLAAPAAHAQDSLSPSLSGSIGDPIYSESTQTGPSSSLVQGDTNLTNSYLRTGISDPLNFLIESGFMSPYAPEGALVSSYAYADVTEQVVNDSTVAERFSDYRNNRVLMSGAGGRSTLAARAALAGSTGSGRSGTGGGNPALGAFSGVSMRAPFAAGSSALATGQPGAMGADSLVDANAALVAAASPTAADVQANAAAGSSSAASSSAAADTAALQALEYGASNLGVPPPNSTALGPAPGEVFPDVSAASSAANGFPDSTMGTAGLPGAESESRYARPMLAEGQERGNPFPGVSEETSSFLHPSLAGPGSTAVEGREAGSKVASISDITRRARLHAMIYTPSAIPSAFQQRAMVRDYERKQRQPRRRSTLTAPSVTH